MYVQADLRLCWSHIPHCWKSHALAQLFEIPFTDVNECTEQTPHPCLNGATCRNQNGDYDCDCVEGWTGKNCDDGKFI